MKETDQKERKRRTTGSSKEINRDKYKTRKRKPISASKIVLVDFHCKNNFIKFYTKYISRINDSLIPLGAKQVER